MRETMSSAMRRATMPFSGCSAAIFHRRAAVPSSVGASSAARRASGRREISAMSSPAKVTESASGRRRFPWHVGHALEIM